MEEGPVESPGEASVNPPGAGDRLAFPVGTTPDGREVTGDFGQTPHVLVGGIAGSGKTHFLHSLIRSLAESHSPAELRLVLFDARRVEFLDYAGLPHLLCRIARDTGEALSAFRKLERKLDRRLESYACTDCADIDEWNLRGDRGVHARIVAVVDAFSDYMCAKDAVVEPLVCRLATDGARAGIHLVIASSRSDCANIFTDAMLSAFPGRMAFRTSSRRSSERFAGVPDAAECKGLGDGLWREPSGELLRVQTPFLGETWREP